MLKNWIIAIIAIHAISNVMVAQMPETRIYLLDITKQRQGYTVSNSRMVGFTKGYNNQPYFSPNDDALLFVANKDNSTTDIYQYTIRNKKVKRITKTKEAEYSPRYTPNEESISCVRVLQDSVTQTFAYYTPKGKKPINMLPHQTKIGYYTWLSGVEIAEFILPEPFTLCRTNITNYKQDTLATHIGRTLVNSRGKLYYVDKSDSTQYYIMQVHKDNLKHLKNKVQVPNIQVIPTLEGQEDFCILNDGTILMGKDGKLYAYKQSRLPQAEDKLQWQLIADLKSMGIGNFYRIACSNDGTKLAVVAYAGAKP
jgi:hypothetical protein